MQGSDGKVDELSRSWQPPANGVSVTRLSLGLTGAAVVLTVLFIAARFYKVQQAADTYRATSHNLLRVYDRWEIYQKIHGEFPQDFNQLIKEGGIQAPICIDPFSPNRDYFKVLRKGAKVYIYSVGPDGVDDKLENVVTNIDWQLSGDYCILDYNRTTQRLRPRHLSDTRTAP